MYKKFTLTTIPFVLLCLLVSASFTFANPLPPSKDELMKDWKRAKDYTKEYLDAMPEEGINFKPTPETRSFAEQMLHIANANFGFAAAASGKKSPYEGKDLEKLEEFKNKAALTKVVMESYDFMIQSVNEVQESKYSEKVKFFDFEIQRGAALTKSFEHQTHHRGQATIYLRLKGVTPPQEKLF